MSEGVKETGSNLSGLVPIIKQINEGFDRRGGGKSDCDPYKLLAKLSEEFGELSVAVRALLGSERDTRVLDDVRKMQADVLSESADVIITLLGLLGKLDLVDGIDKALSDKLQVVLERLKSTGDL